MAADQEPGRSTLPSAPLHHCPVAVIPGCPPSPLPLPLHHDDCRGWSLCGAANAPCTRRSDQYACPSPHLPCAFPCCVGRVLSVVRRASCCGAQGSSCDDGGDAVAVGAVWLPPPGLLSRFFQILQPEGPPSHPQRRPPVRMCCACLRQDLSVAKQPDLPHGLARASGRSPNPGADGICREGQAHRSSGSGSGGVGGDRGGGNRGCGHSGSSIGGRSCGGWL